MKPIHQVLRRERGSATVLAVAARLPEFVRDHFLAGALLLYGALLAGGVLYQLAFDRLLAGPLRRVFESPIVLEK